MSTRELIEAVLEPEDFLDCGSEYRALRAATLAVLDEVLFTMEMHGDMEKKPTRVVATYNLVRALRERLK